MERLRCQLKRVPNWERDQSISGLQQINGRPFLPRDTVANQLASEWRPILCSTHTTLQAPALHQSLSDPITRPVDRVFSAEYDALLMDQIILAEVLAVILCNSIAIKLQDQKISIMILSRVFKHYWRLYSSISATNHCNGLLHQPLV